MKEKVQRAGEEGNGVETRERFGFKGAVRDTSGL